MHVPARSAVPLLLGGVLLAAPGCAQQEFVGKWVSDQDPTVGTLIAQNTPQTYDVRDFDVHRGPDEWTSEAVIFGFDGGFLVCGDGDARDRLSYIKKDQSLRLDRAGALLGTFHRWTEDSQKKAQEMVHSPERKALKDLALAALSDSAMWYRCGVVIPTHLTLIGFVRFDTYHAVTGSATGVFRGCGGPVRDGPLPRGDYAMTGHLADSPDLRDDVLELTVTVPGLGPVETSLVLVRDDDGEPRFRARGGVSEVNLAYARGKMDLSADDYRAASDALVPGSAVPIEIVIAGEALSRGDPLGRGWLRVLSRDAATGELRCDLGAFGLSNGVSLWRNLPSDARVVGLIRDGRVYLQLVSDGEPSPQSPYHWEYMRRYVMGHVLRDGERVALCGTAIEAGDPTLGESLGLRLDLAGRCGASTFQSPPIYWSARPERPWPELNPAEFDYPLRPWVHEQSQPQ